MRSPTCTTRTARRSATRWPPGTDGPAPHALRRLDAASALRLLRTRELRAQRRLVDSSLAAASGALARLLASMSAGIAQQVATLPASRPAGAGR